MVKSAIILATLVLLCLPFPGQAHHDSSLPESVPALQLATIGGSQQALNQYQGQVVLLDFWATWCHMCHELMPVYQAMQEQYGKQGFTVVGIAQDEDPTLVEKWIRSHGIEFPILLDPDMQAAAVFSVIKLPTAILVDRSGTPIARFSGDERNMKQRMREAIAAALAGKPH